MMDINFFNSALFNCIRSTLFVLCEIFRMPKVAMDENADSMVKRRPGGLICRLEPDNTQWIMQFLRSALLAGIFHLIWIVKCSTGLNGSDPKQMKDKG